MKVFKILVIIFAIFIITGCKKEDNVLFKEEYESINTKDGYRKISINKDNPFVYVTDLELLEKIQNKEDMVVYFGFNTCPWCRSIIETLIEVSQDLNIHKIYYLDVLNIRDVVRIDDEGNTITEKEGSKAYLEIVDLLSDYLSDYVVNDTVVGKRIYAPNIMVIKNQKIEEIITGVSDLQTEPMEKLTDDIKKDSYDKIYALLSKYTSKSCSVGNGC